MNTLARNITEWLIVYEAIEQEDRELYEYAIYTLEITIAPLVLVFVIGGLMDVLWESLVMILPFMCIRKFSGGYHAKSASVCMMASCVILCMCIYWASHMEYHVALSAVMMMAVVSLAINSPIDSENRRLEMDEIVRYKRVTILLSVICLFIHIMLLLISLKRYAVCVAIGLLLSACLQLPCIVQRVVKRCREEV